MVSVGFFDSNGEYNEPFPGKGYRNMLIYGADMTSSTYKSNFYYIGKADTQGLQNGKTKYAEHDYVKNNGSEMKQIYVLSICYNGDNSYIILNGVQQS